MSSNIDHYIDETLKIGMGIALIILIINIVIDVINAEDTVTITYTEKTTFYNEELKQKCIELIQSKDSVTDDGT